VSQQASDQSGVILSSIVVDKFNFTRDNVSFKWHKRKFTFNPLVVIDTPNINIPKNNFELDLQN